MKIRKKHLIRAVGEDHLEQYLASLGLLEALERGELRCGVCGCTITEDNLQCFYPHGDEIRVCCNKLACYNCIVREMEGGHE